MQKAPAQEREKNAKLRSCKQVAKMLKSRVVVRYFSAVSASVFRAYIQRKNKRLLREKITGNPLTFCMQFGLIPFSECKQEV